MLPLEKLRGKYDTHSKLASGGMGDVYLVRHRQLDELRVIKVLKAQFAEDEDLKARFFKEARIAAKLSHARIARLLDFEIDQEGVAYIVMEYIHGVTALKFFARAAHREPGIVIEFALQALEGVSFLHRIGFVHRDLSPDNFMIFSDHDDEARVKLIDLGLAKKFQATLHGTTNWEGFAGKPIYASPEQLQGKRLDHRSDIYSFGIILYHLISGKFPFPVHDISALIAGHLFMQPSPLKDATSGAALPDGLEDLILSCLAKTPEQRPDSAESVRARLKSFAPGNGATRFSTSWKESSRELQGELADIQSSFEVPDSVQTRLDAQFPENRRTPVGTPIGLPMAAPPTPEPKTEPPPGSSPAPKSTPEPPEPAPSDLRAEQPTAAPSSSERASPSTTPGAAGTSSSLPLSPPAMEPEDSATRGSTPDSVLQPTIPRRPIEGGGLTPASEPKTPSNPIANAIASPSPTAARQEPPTIVRPTAALSSPLPADGHSPSPQQVAGPDDSAVRSADPPSLAPEERNSPSQVAAPTSLPRPASKLAAGTGTSPSVAPQTIVRPYAAQATPAPEAIAPGPGIDATKKEGGREAGEAVPHLGSSSTGAPQLKPASTKGAPAGPRTHEGGIATPETPVAKSRVATPLPTPVRPPEARTAPPSPPSPPSPASASSPSPVGRTSRPDPRELPVPARATERAEAPVFGAPVQSSPAVQPQVRVEANRASAGRVLAGRRNGLLGAALVILLLGALYWFWNPAPAPIDPTAKKASEVEAPVAVAGASSTEPVATPQVEPAVEVAGTPPALPAAGKGFLFLTAFPWAEIVEIRSTDHSSKIDLPPDATTPLRIELAAGEYTIVFRSPDSKSISSVRSVVTSGRSFTQALPVASAKIVEFLASDALR